MNTVKSLTIEAAKQLVNSASENEDFLLIPGITNLYEGEALVLATYRGGLVLDDLTRLSDSAATALLAHKGGLSFNGLINISDELADILKQYQGDLTLNINSLDSINSTESLVSLKVNCKTLKIKSAKKLMCSERKNEDFLFIPKIVNVDDDAAAVISSYTGKILLDDLTILSDSAATILLNHKGGLSLKSLRNISDELAEILVLYQGELSLSIEYFKTVSSSLARLIINVFKAADSLDFKNIEDIDWDAAKILADFHGSLLLNNLTQISHSSARMLSFHEGPIELNGIMNLTSLAASALACHRGNLFLNGISHLDKSVAAYLVQHSGLVELRNVASVSTEVAMILAANGENIFLNVKDVYTLKVFDVLASKNRIYPFSLDNFTFEKLTASSARFLVKILATHKLDPTCSKTNLSLGQHSGDLILTELTTLAVDVARSLSAHRGILNLDGLIQISDNVAEALSKHTGELHLNGLVNISDEASRHLSKHLGLLSLDGLHEISESFACYFTDHSGILSLRGVNWISEESAMALSKRDKQFPLRGLNFIEELDIFTPGLARLCARLGRQCNLQIIDEEIAKVFLENWTNSSNQLVAFKNIQTLNRETAIILCENWILIESLILYYVEESALRVFLEADVTVVCIPSTSVEVNMLIEMYEKEEIERENKSNLRPGQKTYIKNYKRSERAYMAYMKSLMSHQIISKTDSHWSEIQCYYKFKEQFPVAGTAFDEAGIYDVLNSIDDQRDSTRHQDDYYYDAELDRAIEESREMERRELRN
jgi:hypothetical protein